MLCDMILTDPNLSTSKQLMSSGVIASQQTDASDLSQPWPQPQSMSASFLQSASELKIMPGNRERKTVGERQYSHQH